MARNETVKNKIRGSLIGGAVGDALGYPVEFLNEAQIASKFEEFAKAVGDDNIASAKDVSNELLLLIRNRNQKCKMLK